MSNYAAHECPRREGGLPDRVTCGGCGRSWCEACDPAPSALCHWCNGRGYSTAPVPPRQARLCRHCGAKGHAA